MKRQLAACERITQSITTEYSKNIWNPFIKAIGQYELIQENDRIAVCISGGKDSMLLALLMKMYRHISSVPFSLEFLVMDPGYHPENRRKIEENAALLQIPVTFFETNIFQVASHTRNNPCFLCAKMRRGHLYHRAQQLGCNKIALGHHFNDVIETTVMGMFYGAQLQAMAPKVRSRNFDGMELIRPLYCVHEEAIISWMQKNELSFLQCACHMTQNEGNSKRQEIKDLLASLSQQNPNIEKNIFHSIHTVCLDTFPAYKIGKQRYSFLESYDMCESRNTGAAVDKKLSEQEI
jgi:tRNA(Ile)-lysidine synthase TilS/MesJ